jgi:hypothetical protein
VAAIVNYINLHLTAPRYIVVTPDPGVAPIYHVEIFAAGKPAAGATATIERPLVTVLFSINMVGSRAEAKTAATGTAVFTIYKNTTSIGTITFSPGGTTATFSVAAATTISPTDYLLIACPAVQDATLADITLNLNGTR